MAYSSTKGVEASLQGYRRIRTDYIWTPHRARLNWLLGIGLFFAAIAAIVVFRYYLVMTAEQLEISIGIAVLAVIAYPCYRLYWPIKCPHCTNRIEKFIRLTPFNTRDVYRCFICHSCKYFAVEVLFVSGNWGG